MKTHRITIARRIMMLVTTGVLLSWGGAQAETPGEEVLTRGPVHEAFAEAVASNPEPILIVQKSPPEAIEEVPPDERPEGNNVTWIPGYWAWDDERDDFLWVSGIWRALPPGRKWITGYWSPAGQGFQWAAGYWADASIVETDYLPPPPATLEVGANIAAPSPDYLWVPGCWIWRASRYAWRPGYWVQGRADWDWIPSHYVCAPRGYVYCEGYWDYAVPRRGVLFAPVYFDRSVSTRVSFTFAPSVVIDIGVIIDQIFVRPSHHHFYFGDYYDSRYLSLGFYSSFSSHRDHRDRDRYDPFYSRVLWEHRRDRDWEHRAQKEFQYRRDHEDARPPRTYRAQVNRSTTNITNVTNVTNVTNINIDQRHFAVGAPLDQIAKRKDNPIRFQRVAKDEKVSFANRGREVREARMERQTLEGDSAGAPARQSSKSTAPRKVKLPKSTIIAMPADRLAKADTPPNKPKMPRLDLKVRSETKGGEGDPNSAKVDTRARNERARANDPGRDPNSGDDGSRPQQSDGKTRPSTRRMDPRLLPTVPEPVMKREDARPDQPKAAPQPERSDAKPQQPEKEPRATKEDARPRQPKDAPQSSGPDAKPKQPGKEPRTTKEDAGPNQPKEAPQSSKPDTKPEQATSEPRTTKSDSETGRPKTEPGTKKSRSKREAAPTVRNRRKPRPDEGKSSPKQDSKVEDKKESKGLPSGEKPKDESSGESKKKEKNESESKSNDRHTGQPHEAKVSS